MKTKAKPTATKLLIDDLMKAYWELEEMEKSLKEEYQDRLDKTYDHYIKRLNIVMGLFVLSITALAISII